MNGLLFHFSDGEVIVIMNSINIAGQAKWEHCVEILAVCICICFVHQTKAVVSSLIKLDSSFPAVQLLRNKHFTIKVCGPAGDMKAP
jgi:hypothetical protein